MGVFDHPHHQYVASLSTQPTTEHIRSQLNADVLYIHTFLDYVTFFILSNINHYSYNIRIHTSVCCSISKNVLILILKHIHAHIIAFYLR